MGKRFEEFRLEALQRVGHDALSPSFGSSDERSTLVGCPVRVVTRLRARRCRTLNQYLKISRYAEIVAALLATKNAAPWIA
jgi:hypothetical protein